MPYTLFVLFWFDIHIVVGVVGAVNVVTGKSFAHATQQNYDHSHICTWEMVWRIACECERLTVEM